MGALLIDMNGNEVKLWAGLEGFPNKILPGGYVLGSTGSIKSKYSYQDEKDLVQVDWNGNIVWKFDKTELYADPGQEPQYFARQHHDYQREGLDSWILLSRRGAKGRIAVIRLYLRMKIFIIMIFPINVL